MNSAAGSDSGMSGQFSSRLSSAQQVPRLRSDQMDQSQALPAQPVDIPIDPKTPMFGWHQMTYDPERDRLGAGAYGTCFKVKHNILGRAVIKIPLQTNLQTGDTLDVQYRQRREAALGLMLNHHPNIVAFFGYAFNANWEHPDGFLMEYMAGGSLFNFIHKNYNQESDERMLNGWSRQIAQGLCFIHSRGIMHRDLNPNNILLSRDLFTAKITDFGLSKKVETAEQTWRMTTRVGTAIYTAPEVFLDNKYHYPVDVYSYAMTLYFIYYRQHPFNQTQFERWGSFTTVQKLTGQFFSAGVQEPELRPQLAFATPNPNHDDIIAACWKSNPEERWTIATVLWAINHNQNLLPVDDD